MNVKVGHFAIYGNQPVSALIHEVEKFGRFSLEEILRRQNIERDYESGNREIRFGERNNFYAPHAPLTSYLAFVGGRKSIPNFLFNQKKDLTFQACRGEEFRIAFGKKHRTFGKDEIALILYADGKRKTVIHQTYDCYEVKYNDFYHGVTSDQLAMCVNAILKGLKLYSSPNVELKKL